MKFVVKSDCSGLMLELLFWGPPLLLPEVKLRHKPGTSRFKIAKRIIFTNKTVHFLVRKWSLDCE